MSLVIGLDTGGTFTDGVVIDLESKELKAKAKSFTTHENLALGIISCIKKLEGVDPNQIQFVTLSTTLATNAIAEGRGCRVGLILIGHEATGTLPVEKVICIGGGHNIQGEQEEELDIEALHAAVESMRGKVDAIALSGFLSVRNPDHELRALREVREQWDVPVVCAHQLTTVLGFHERTITACLNAHLLPIIADLLEAVSEALRQHGITAPLMIVRGDGTLMSESVAREQPIETILSGPAASVIGATFLAGTDSALCLDMGGTTSDVFLLEGGKPRLNREGATVGGWRTRVQALDISAFGLGGDSHIRISRDGDVAIGPRRVWPLSVVALDHPIISEEIARVDPETDLGETQVVDCVMLLKKNENLQRWSSSEREVIEALRDGPHNIIALGKLLERDANLLQLKALEDARVIGRCSFTPTDMLHVLGKFDEYDTQTARIAAAKLAASASMDEEDFILHLEHEMRATVGKVILQSLVYREGEKFAIGDGPAAGFLLDAALRQKHDNVMGIKIALKHPIIGLGAPANAYMPAMEGLLNTPVLVPKHAEVANAVGTAACQLVEQISITISPTVAGFVVHLPWKRQAFLYLEEAENFAIQEGRREAAKRADEANVRNPEISVVTEDVVSRGVAGEDDVYLGSHIEIIAKGRPGSDRRSRTFRMGVERHM